MPHFIKWFYFFQISSFFFHHHFVRVQGGDFNFFLLSAHFTRLLLPFSFFFFPSVLSSNPHTTFFVPPLFKTPNNYHLVFLRKISATFSKRKFPFTRVEQKSIFLPDLWSTWTNIVFFFSFFRGCFFFLVCLWHFILFFSYFFLSCLIVNSSQSDFKLTWQKQDKIDYLPLPFTDLSHIESFFQCVLSSLCACAHTTLAGSVRHVIILSSYSFLWLKSDLLDYRIFT